MNIVFRVDASVSIGSGHVMRCLTLADELKRQGMDIMFISREHSGHLVDAIQNRGHKTITLPVEAENKQIISVGNVSHASWLGVSWEQDARETITAIGDQRVDWLIVDHYGIDACWHSFLREKTRKIFVIDDLADRKLDCDILLDQNYYLSPYDRYSNLVPTSCRCFLGPQYAMLRHEFFAVAQKQDCKSLGKINRIFVFMGGSDFTNETQKVIYALDQFESQNIMVDIIVGSINPNSEIIHSLCDARDNYNYYNSVNNISELMKNADLAIGAGGATTLERCFLGLPSLVVLVAENQKETIYAMDKINALVCVGWHERVTQVEISDQIHELYRYPAKLENMCVNSKKLMGGNNYLGTAGVVKQLRQLNG